jgi:uncharacterized OsmC-like protein
MTLIRKGIVQAKMQDQVRKDRVPIQISAQCCSHSETEVSIGKHSIVIDEPTGRGGSDQGASPLEHLLAGLAGSTNVALHRVAHEAEVQLRNVTINITGWIDVRGACGTRMPATTFPEIHRAVTGETTATAEQIQSMREALRWRCPATSVLLESESTIVDSWKLESSSLTFCEKN